MSLARSLQNQLSPSIQENEHSLPDYLLSCRIMAGMAFYSFLAFRFSLHLMASKHCFLTSLFHFALILFNSAFKSDISCCLYVVIFAIFNLSIRKISLRKGGNFLKRK